MEDAELRALRAEVEDLRRRLSVSATPDSPGTPAQTSQARLADAESQNLRLAAALRELRDEVTRLRAEVEALSAPPSAYGVLLGINDDGTADVLSNGRKLRVVAPESVVWGEVRLGDELVLNEAQNIIGSRRPDLSGDVVTVADILDDGYRAVVTTRSEDRRVLVMADAVRGTLVRPGDTYMADLAAGLLLEKLPRPEVDDLLLETSPTVTFSDIGGLSSQIEMITDAVELPFLHPDLYAEYGLQAPKGILLYGPPGCGKTMVAKAVANSLARKVVAGSGGEKVRSYFINVKGPELLNKYVGETERQIRGIFQRARERSAEGWPVIIFFDEMDSMFRARGTGVSSDVESTIVPQLLAELDGVETLSNVIVIGATNREDLIDPAILRPGRLDVKIKIDRPDTDAAREILDKYLPADDLLNPGGLADRGAMVDRVVAELYRADEQTQFLEVTYQNGDRETLYFRDFCSGAMIDNIVRRAKKDAIKRRIAGGDGRLVIDDLVGSIKREFTENEDLPNTTNPDDWARISGRKGERIALIRTLVRSEGTTVAGGKLVEPTQTGQYL